MNRFSLLLILIGLAMMTYSVYEYVPQFLIGQYGEESVQKALAKEKTQTPPQGDGPLYEKRPKMDEKFGELVIPRLKAVLPIIEGTDPNQLERGIGHYNKSVLPGEDDNAVLSGHRDTVFRKLGELQIGDELIINTTAGTFTYKIAKTWITDDDDRTVIVSHKGNHILTLTTCYPFNWIGSAPQRYIIQAKLSSSQF